MLSFSLILTIAAGIGIASLAWFVMDWISPDKGRAEERIDELRDPSRRRGRGDSTSVARMLQQAAPKLASPLTPKNEEETSKLKLRLTQSGFRAEGASAIFLGLKIVGLVIGLIVGGGSTIMLNGIGQKSIMISIAIAGVMFYVPDALVWFIGKRRKESIFLGLPDALDLMVVCVEAGLGLDQAMRKVAEEMRKSYRTIAEEFALCNLQLQMGRARHQVLQELGQRSGVEDLQQLASILVQADKFGSSIATALRVQSDSMRTRRSQIAEEKAAKTAVKLIFPLVMFIFPGIFVVLVGPAAITMIREMLPAMGGG
jgi:tight adherence protein C